jgi:hypothetical protein
MTNNTTPISELFEKASKYVPAITIIAYVFGFVIVNSYLSNYNIFDDNLFSINYIKAGLLFSLILLPLFIIIFKNYSNPTDNFNISKWELAGLSVNIFSYVCWISVFFVLFGKPSPHISSIIVSVFSGEMLVFLLTTGVPGKSFSQGKKIIYNLIFPVILIIILSIYYAHFRYFYAIFIFTAIQFTLFLGQYGDKKITIKDLAISLVLLIFASAFFGKYVYGNLTRTFGGNAPFSAILVLNNNENQLIVNKMLHPSSTQKQINVDILYSTPDKYILKYDSTVAAIDKSLIAGFILSHK